MLAVRTGQLTAGDFHPIGFTALSAAPPTAWASPAPRLRENLPQYKTNYKARVTVADQLRKRRRVQALAGPPQFAYLLTFNADNLALTLADIH